MPASRPVAVARAVCHAVYIHVSHTSSTTCCSWACRPESRRTGWLFCLFAEPSKHRQTTAASQARPQPSPHEAAASTLLLLGICSQSSLLALPLCSSCICLPLFSLLNGFTHLPLLTGSTAQRRKQCHSLLRTCTDSKGVLICKLLQAGQMMVIS